MELFHLDIEVVGQYKDFETFESSDEKGSKLFKSKFDKLDWKSKYESIDEAYISQAGLISTYGKICCISFGYIDNGVSRINSIYGHDEKEIVEKFNNLLLKIEQKNFSLSGYRIIFYDIPWILHKLHKYGIEPANIIYTYDKKPWECRVVDMAEDWKGKLSIISSFDEVCYELGIDSPKTEMGGCDVHKKYWDGGLEQVKDYCERDINASIEISKKIYKSF